jgi:hypothetical protein
MPPNVRLSSPTFRFAGTEVAPDDEHGNLLIDPVQKDHNDVDSAAFAYPVYPVVNSVSDTHGDSQVNDECPFTNRIPGMTDKH